MAEITSLEGVVGTLRTPGQLLALIEQIDLAIYNLLTDPAKVGFRYRLGDREIDRDGYLLWLLDARKTYQTHLSTLPVWEATVCVGHAD
jgi:hypothetical protein